MRPDISVIIPVRDHADRLEALLAGLPRDAVGGCTLETLVIDDGSRSDPTPLCERYGAQCLRERHSRGPAAARNRGATAARGRFLAFFDADVEYAEGMLETAVAALEREGGPAAISFMNQAYDPKDGIVANFGATIERFWFEDLFHGDDERADVSGFTTRNGVVRRDAFEAIGGFDASFTTNGGEDYDFGKRLAAGRRIVLARAPVLYHNFPRGLPRLLRNYYVRTALFVPYFLRNRPPFDRTQTSRPELAIRLMGAATLGPLVLAATPAPGKALWLLAAAALYAGYAWGIRRFLAAAYRSSGRSPRFVCACFLVHYMSTLVILAGGCRGLAAYLTGSRPSAQPSAG